MKKLVLLLLGAARRLVQFEILLLTLVYLYFVLTDQVPLSAFLLIALIWLARKWTTGAFTRRTPLDAPIVFILLWLFVSLAVSINWFTSLPKVYGVLLGAAFYFALVNQIRTRADLARAAFWLVIVCTGIAAAGLIGTDWAQSRIAGAAFIYDHLPRFIQGIPRSIAGGFARNGVGGTLALTIPLLAALLASPKSKVQSPESQVQSPKSTSDMWANAFFPLVVGAFALSIATLALTQSRGGILGTLIGIAGVALWREKKFAWLLGAAIFALIILIALGYGNAPADSFLRIDAANGTLASRMEVWQRGWMMVQDFPITGIGIGTYNQIAHLLYPFFIAAPDEIVPHAHNQFLQVAVDMGAPGLIAYVALLSGYLFMCWRGYVRTKDTLIRALCVGLFCGMLAHHVFGLTDAFILGTKPGIVMWIYFGFAGAIYLLTKGHKENANGKTTYGNG